MPVPEIVPDDLDVLRREVCNCPPPNRALSSSTKHVLRRPPERLGLLTPLTDETATVFDGYLPAIGVHTVGTASLQYVESFCEIGYGNPGTYLA
jgi:hypothetical protein